MGSNASSLGYTIHTVVLHTYMEKLANQPCCKHACNEDYGREILGRVRMASKLILSHLHSFSCVHLSHSEDQTCNMMIVWVVSRMYTYSCVQRGDKGALTCCVLMHFGHYSELLPVVPRECWQVFVHHCLSRVSQHTLEWQLKLSLMGPVPLGASACVQQWAALSVQQSFSVSVARVWCWSQVS